MATSSCWGKQAMAMHSMSRKHYRMLHICSLVCISIIIIIFLSHELNVMTLLLQAFDISVHLNMSIDYFRIPHNTLCLPAKFCITYCLKMLLGKCNAPRSI